MPRKVLALLLVHANHVVPVSALISELWDDQPPPSAPTTLQTYIVQIRRVLRCTLGLSAAEVSNDILCTWSGAYQFKADHVDLYEFTRLSARGQQQLGEGDVAGGMQTLQSALALWRGPALVDVRAGRLLQAEVSRLHESRLTVCQKHIEAALQLGLHQEVLGELLWLAAQHPLHENLHAQYMIALYRCGRRNDALHAYQRLRASLVRELGLEPSLRLRRLHQAMLSGDPVLDTWPAGDAVLPEGQPTRVVRAG
ncbi:AfsR/SARP family transcriptional regulator [Actinomadura sp. ATCC 31491]|uniref:AfsR/SARP family transcriptional regulator n=1 Tax=Actinomadura luzonensis TaxID=2805427 RepID=A0ABT0G915_9ACTN|nr:AfsR/SARP family transcriptional regulator [Actinomadura luzonensis]MCK2221082.1 AfsR/SARP family transcriptional regulator [Actinomadura luzonensis]